MKIEIARLAKQLRGNGEGRRHYAEFCRQLAEARPGSVVFLDFRGVHAISGSWIDAALGPFFRWCAEPQNDFFPVLTRFPEADLDELNLVARIHQQCYPVASGPSEPVLHVRLVGPLDAGLRSAVLKLAELGEPTGAELARRMPDEGIQATAWNNRLRDLYGKRVLLRRKLGCQQLYSPVAKEVELHGAHEKIV